MITTAGTDTVIRGTRIRGASQAAISPTRSAAAAAPAWGAAPASTSWIRTVFATIPMLAAWWAPRVGVPRITVSVPAVVIMVPGAAAYRAVFHLNNGDTTQALAFGFQAGLVIVAIAIGLAVARMLTDKAWAFERW